MFEIYNKQANRNSRLIESEAYTWKPLNFLNLYSLLLSGVFTSFYFVGNPFPQLASHNTNLFYSASTAYLISTLAFGLMITYRVPNFNQQVHLHIFSDIFFIALIMHASGGIQSGLGTLIIISIAAGSIFIRRRHSLLFASVASLTILYENFYSSLEGLYLETNLLQSGILGLTFFSTSIITHFIAKLAVKRGVDLENMSQLTEHIIQRMQTGIIVIDKKHKLRLINESAWHMLSMPTVANHPHLLELNQDLNDHYIKWENNNETTLSPLSLSPEYPSIIPRFAQLNQEKKPAILIFLEDASALSREAQQLQLASLGRLTASIAHEIRNPLGAICHAGQLLTESPNMDKADLRLTQIISDHSKRVNTIIENVLQLGRGNKSYPQLVDLNSYLENFLADFMVSSQTQRENYLIKCPQSTIKVRFDPSHLQQILTNLSENALRYSIKDSESTKNTKKIKIEFHVSISENNNRPFIDIIDHGTGIDNEIAAHIFEPFYTTADTGTGLGLYISRELAECNQAHLTLLKSSERGSHFRLTFSDPRRQMH